MNTCQVSREKPNLSRGFGSVLPAAWLALSSSLAWNVSAQVTCQNQVLADLPLAYYRLSASGPATTDIATNRGSLQGAGNGVHHVGVIHPVAGALVGDPDSAASYVAVDASSCDGGSPTVVPFNAGFNTAAFSVEAWLKPDIDGLANAQAPLYSRREDSPRTGWVLFQRPSTVPIADGTGWNFRMYNGVDTSRSIDITGGTGYAIGVWHHLVATFDGTTGRLYMDGVEVGSQAVVGNYAPNASPVPLSIGSFPLKTTGSGYENPFVGGVDEVAIYTNALSAGQVLAHYQNGTNATPATQYPTLIASDHAVEYLRLDEPAHDLATNSGSLGTGATGIYAYTPAAPAGPQSPGYPGFDAVNLSQNFGGSDYVELGNPAALNLSGILTLEAWIQPAAAQGFDSYIIAHGGNDDFSGEVFLRIENGNYQIGSNNGKASASVPPGDLGGINWVHLAGTYDGFSWTLYRNGVQVAIGTDYVGAYEVNNANWALGARGRWKTFKDVLDRQFNGRIDEAAIYNSALSADRIQAHYYAGKYANLAPAATIAQQPVSKSGFAGTPASLSVGADGAPPLSYQWYRGAIPVGTDSPTLSFANLQASDAGNYTVTVSSPAGSTNSAIATLTVLAGYGSVICQDQPTAYYPLNETSGSMAYDRFSGAYNGAYQYAGSSVTLGVSGPSANTGAAARFTSGGRVWIGNPTALNQSGQMTLEAWIKPTGTGGEQYILAHGIDWATYREVVLRIESGVYQVGPWYWDGSSWQDHASMTVPAADLNTWVHLVGTYDGASWRLYHNGVLVSTKATGGPIGLSQDWAIGGAGSAERWFAGDICQVAIYTTALSAPQVQLHYAAGQLNPLTISRSGGATTLTWAAGTLQQADNVSGPYSDVAGATSPHNPSTAGAGKFYRLRF